MRRSPTIPASEAPATFGDNTYLDELDLREAPLRDALVLIGKASDTNIVASDDAAKTKITIHLAKIRVVDAVKAICQTHGLFYNQKSKNADEDKELRIDIVTTVKEFQQGLTVFREEKSKVYTLLYPNAWDLAAAVRNLFGSRVQLSRGKDDIYDESQDIQRRLDRFDIINSRSQGLGSNSLNSSGSSGGSGGSSGSSGGGSNSSRTGSGGGGLGSGVGAAAFQNQRFDAARMPRFSATAPLPEI